LHNSHCVLGVSCILGSKKQSVCKFMTKVLRISDKCVQEDMERGPFKFVNGHEYRPMIMEYMAKGPVDRGEGALLTPDAYMLPLTEASALPNACTPP
jgi:hypothetical protein